MVDVTMLTYGRPKLCAQALTSLERNTEAGTYRLTTYDDQAKLGTGAARNKVIEMAREGHNDLLYLSDNDVYFPPKWLPALVECYQFAHEHLGVIALGAYLHPYNQPYRKHLFYSEVLGEVVEIGIVHALSTQSWLWSWEDVERFLPFVTTPVGRVACSEDVEMSLRIQKTGGLVGVVVPALIANTAVTNSFGEPVVGSDLLVREPAMGAYRE